MRTFVMAMVAVLGLSQGSLLAGEDSALKSKLDGVIDKAVAQKHVVGVVVLVARDGQVVYERAAGLADREAARPMKTDEVFRLASMTKTLVSAAALALVEEGRLRLDDPVTKWLPTFRPKLADGTQPAITVHQLLTHTSGLSYGFLERPDGPYHRANVSDGLDQPGLSLEENLRRLASVPLLFRPGTAWNYSLSIDVLGAVVAQAGGASLPEVVAQRVTSPLKMDHTSFEVRDPGRLATPYADGTPEPARMEDNHTVRFGEEASLHYSPSRAFDRKSFPSGGAGMVGTASDYLVFLETLRTGGGKILKPETVRQMTSNQIGDLPILSTEGPGWGFGYGFAILKDQKDRQTPHTPGSYQWGGAYGSHWFVDPARKLTFVVLTNTAIAGMAGEFPNQLRDAIYSADH